MSKLDKVKYVLEQASGPLSIEQITKLTRFDQDIVSFIIDELRTANKVKVEATGEIRWAAKVSPMEIVRSRKVI